MAAFRGKNQINLSKEIEKALDSEQILTNENVQAILEAATNYALSKGDLDPELLFSECLKIIRIIENWIKDFEIKKQKLEKIRWSNYNSVAKQIQGTIDDVKAKHFLEYLDEKKQKSYEQAIKNFIDSFLKGFALWETFRSIVTHQAINYSILYKDGTKIYEAKKISVKELLFERIDIDKISINYSRDKKEITNLSIKFDSKGFKSKEDEKMIGANYRFYMQLENRYLNLVKHRGSIYETFEEIRMTFRHFPLQRGVTSKWFENEKMNDWIVNSLKENDSDWASGRRVGDQGTTQLKNIIENAANFSSTNTLLPDMKKLVSIFSLDNKTLVNDLIELFTEDITKNNVHLSSQTEIMNQKAKDAIKANFK